MKRRSVVWAALALPLWVRKNAWAAEQIGLFQKEKNIGVTPKRGTASYDPSSGEYSVTGGGANIWDEADAFEFLYRKISGDVSLAADVDFVGKGAEPHRKAALMIRQSLNADSAYADVAVHGDGLAALQYRETAGATTSEMRSEVKGPIRIHIRRQGNQFTISAGKNADEMTTTGPVTVTMQDPVYIGLAVCSHDAKILETAVFSNVRVAVDASKFNKKEQ